MGRILLRSLGPVWPLGLLALAGAGLLWALEWPAEAFVAALGAATLALLATPITLLPGARMLAELRRADPGRAPGGSLWPGLSWALRVPPVALPLPNPVPMAGDETAAQMSAAVRAIASEIALLKRQGTEMRRSFTEAVEAGHRMATAAETAGLWFDDTARRSTEAAATLGQLQAMATAQATSLGTLTDHAGQALALLSDAAPGKAWLEAVMARVPELPGQLDAALQRVEAGAAALTEAGALPERMAEQVSALETAGERLQVLAGALPDQVASLGAVARELDGVAGLPARFEVAFLRADEQVACLAATATNLAAMIALPERFDAVLARTKTQMAGLAAAAQGLDAMTGLPEQLDATLTRTDAQLANLQEMAQHLAGLAALPDRVDAVLARTTAQLAEFAATALQLDGMAHLPERLEAQLGRVAEGLDATMGLLPGQLAAAIGALAGQVAEAGQGRLAQGLADSDARLQAVTAVLEAITLRLDETLSQTVAERLDGIAAPMHRAIAGLTEAGEALAPMAAGLAGLVQQIPRLEAAIGRAAEAPAQTAAQLAAVTGAIEAMVRQARPAPAEGGPRPGRSVSARILGQLDAAAEPAVTATLLRLDGVETEVEQLLRRAEHLVEGPGGVAPASPGLAQHAPALLEGLDATIRQLQSVATAIAVAADRGSRRVAAWG